MSYAQAANLLRKRHGIKVTGGTAPSPLASFDELGVVYKCSKRLLAKLEEHGWHEPTPIQRQAIPVLLKRRELFAIAPTGGEAWSAASILKPVKPSSHLQVHTILLGGGLHQLLHPYWCWTSS